MTLSQLAMTKISAMLNWIIDFSLRNRAVVLDRGCSA